MRLHRLRLTAFGPFADQQEIDFDRLAASGLFLLEGPTGAGKTSVLDAVTFALYGGLSSGSAGADRLHSHFAAPMVEPSVELEFSVRGVRYRVRRTPEWQRPRRRGPGTTPQRGSVHVERWQTTAWLSVSSSKAQAGELIGELLGLNREQFAQVVLLPQGEFAAFLRASDDERRQLLTRLFDALLYDEITEELTRRRVAAAQAIDEAAVRTRDRLSAAAEAAGLDAAAREAILAGDPAGRAGELERLGAALGRAAQDAAGRAATSLVELVTAQDRRESATAEWQAAVRLQAAEEALRSHRDGIEDSTRDRNTLLAARRAAPVGPLLAQARERTAVVEQLRAGIVGVASAASVASVASAASRASGASAPGIDRFAAEVEPLRAQALALRRESGQLTAASETEMGLPWLRDEFTAAQLAADVADKLVARLEDRRGELPDLVISAGQERADARDATTALPGLLARADRLGERVKAARALEVTSRRLDQLRAERIEATETHQRAVDEHQLAVQGRLTGLAGELAGHLQPGRPCGVCGATSHPAPAVAGSDAVTAPTLLRAERARRVAEQARAQVDGEWWTVSAKHAGLEAAAGSEPVEDLAAAHRQAEQAVYVTEAVAATLAESEARLTEREVERDRWQATRERAGTEAALARGRSDSAAVGLGAAEQAVEAARGRHPSVTARQEALIAAANVAAGRADAITDLVRAATEERSARQRAESAATAAGFAALAEVRSAERTAVELSELEQRLSRWDQVEATLRATLDAAEAAGRREGEPETAGRDPAERADQVGRCERAARQARATAQAADARARGAQSQADSTAAAAARFETRHAEWRQAELLEAESRRAGAGILHLAALTRGMAGHRRTTLTTYVLRHWFERVVAAANTRLGSMSAGRYALLRTDVGARSNERTGLGLRVVDQHTGEQRGAASMSGGETFYTSLALALGLADVVSAEAGGVELDTLFIDEGFGSLDPETLDQVMGVIDDLRENGRVIGIVSHVAELKERVQERVAVRRRADGASTLTVLA